MLCKDCPLSLPCYGGMLDAACGGVQVRLCPKCEYLIVPRITDTGLSFYYLFCEMRPFKRGLDEAWYQYTHDTHSAGLTVLGEAHIVDPVGLKRKLILGPCDRCNPDGLATRIFSGLQLDVNYIYLEGDEKDGKEEKEDVDTQEDRHIWQIGRGR